MPTKYSRFNKIRRGRTTKRRTTARVARTALRKVNRIIKGVEHKKTSYTTFHTPTFISDDGQVIPVSGITQGVGYANRVGNEVVARNLNIVGRVTRGISGPPVNVMRLVLFHDRQEVPGTTPALTEMFDPVTMGGLMAPFSQFNRANVGRFQMLRSWRVIVDSSNPSKQFKFNFKFRKLHKIRFSGTTITDTSRGTIWFAAISDCDPTAPAGSRPELLADIRFSFLDD